MKKRMMEIQKFHRIGNSKEPTLQQMLKMAENLRTKLNTYISIRFDVVAYSTGKNEIDFVIYAGNHERFKTWSETLVYYRKLMKGK